MEKKNITQEILNKLSTNSFKNFFNIFEDGRGVYTILNFINEQEEDVIAGDISKHLNVSTARVAVALTNLEKKKYIEKLKDVDDGRKTIVKITNLGKIALRERQTKLENTISVMLEKLSKKDSKILLEIISKLITPSGNLA